LDQPVSDPVLPRDQVGPNKGEMATNISAHLQHLRGEVTRLRHQLDVSKKESKYIKIDLILFLTSKAGVSNMWTVAHFFVARGYQY